MTRVLDALVALFRPRPRRLSDTQWQALLDTVALARGLDAAQRETLRVLVERFLAEKTITPVAGLELAPTMVHAIAALCCLPLLRVGRRGLAGWSQVIVYPGSFRARRHHVDDETGVVIEGEEDLAGEAWEAGPIVLSWEDIASDLHDPTPGFNVAVHEMAHKLDLLDGMLDGTPPLPGGLQADWARDFQQAYDALVSDLEAGREPVIDEYAASAPEEFFAVVSEYHFTAPQHLEEVMPRVARHLHRVYGPPPRSAPRPKAPEESAR